MKYDVCIMICIVLCLCIMVCSVKCNVCDVLYVMGSVCVCGGTCVVCSV